MRWGEQRAETFVHELELAEDENGDTLAALRASRGFPERDVRNVVVTEGNLLVSHQPVYDRYYWHPGIEEEQEENTILTILGQDGLSARGDVEVDRWSTLEAAHEGRALYTVPGGLLVINVEDAAHPYAQAFFHSNGWPEQILFEGGDITVAAGRYGLYRFDATEWNLLSR